MNVTAVFDIGKTNKKFFLFDEHLNEVHRSYVHLEEGSDDDGYACENLEQLTAWMLETFREAQAMPEFEITHLNFSTYGASFVHLDEQDRPVTPLYNYLKPFPGNLYESFFEKYGPADEWSAATASPDMGMLNSGLQLYWLKHVKPEVFSRIRRSLHFPQYCSFLFTGKHTNEYTSIGCHTGLWDFTKHDYHRWVYEEKINQLFPAVQPTTSTVETAINGKKVRVGAGIHDSSAALLPYIISNEQPFLLISTGTWSITLNPFCRDELSVRDLQRDCLNYMRTDGLPVRASRLFLGNEYKIWVRKLADHFRQSYERHRNVEPDPAVLKKLARFENPVYRWESIRMPGSGKTASPGTDLGIFSSYEEAYHQLIRELADLQVSSLYLAKGAGSATKVYIDGGFIDNRLFIQLLSDRLQGFELITTEAPLGSALGAAIAVHNRTELTGALSGSSLLQKTKA
ncbi:MAG: FGGY family carbohydrate kinase [Saprospiraceae bacterium]